MRPFKHWPLPQCMECSRGGILFAFQSVQAQCAYAKQLKCGAMMQVHAECASCCCYLQITILLLVDLQMAHAHFVHEDSPVAHR